MFRGRRQPVAESPSLLWGSTVEPPVCGSAAGQICEVAATTSSELDDVEQACMELYKAAVVRFRHLERLERGDALSSEEYEGPSQDSSEFLQCEASRKPESQTNDDQMAFQDPTPFAKAEGAFGHFAEENAIALLFERLCLRRNLHQKFLWPYLFGTLKPSMFSLDASRPWMFYWSVHAAALLNDQPTTGASSTFDIDALFFQAGSIDSRSSRTAGLSFCERSARFVKSLAHPLGGFGGGPRQIGHLATTYAAIAGLIEARSFDALLEINRVALFDWLQRLKDQETGGFRVHEDGELDVRGAYCAVAVASFLELPTDRLFDGLERYICGLQAFDGGLAGAPGLEAHAGYTYCGLAALAILKKAEALDLEGLLHWTVHRQMEGTGGFQGRPNKLPDSCYSFWCTGILEILRRSGLQPVQSNTNVHIGPAWFSAVALQSYVLACCQESVKETVYTCGGGLRDKPGAKPDAYHTCYALSGLSLAQQETESWVATRHCTSMRRLQITCPLFNVTVDALEAFNKFRKRSFTGFSFSLAQHDPPL